MDKKKLAKAVLAEINVTANSIARLNGYGFATKIIKGDELKMVEVTPTGYRKFTTDEYVSNAYRNKFGWKNTYYQNLKCVVSIGPALWAKKEKWKKFLRNEK